MVFSCVSVVLWRAHEFPISINEVRSFAMKKSVLRLIERFGTGEMLIIQHVVSDSRINCHCLRTVGEGRIGRLSRSSLSMLEAALAPCNVTDVLIFARAWPSSVG